MIKFVTGLILSAPFLVFSCADKKDESKSKADPEAAENQPEEAAEVPSVAGALAITTGSGVLQAVSVALGTTNESAAFGDLSASSPSLGAAGNISIVVESGAASLLLQESDNSGDDGKDTPKKHPTNPNCSKSGEPLVAADGSRYQGSEYAVRRFYCLLTDGGSPDTIVGAITISKGFICMAEKNGLSYSEAGETIKFSLSEFPTECFSEAVKKGAAEDMGEFKFDLELTGKTLSSESGWDKEITTVVVGEEKTPEVVRFAIRGQKVAFANLSGYGASLDFETGTMRAYNLNNNEDGRNMRILVTGDLQQDGTFKSVSSFEGFSADASERIVSVKGTPELSFVFQDYSVRCDSQYCDATGTPKISRLATVCLPAVGGCSATGGLVFSSLEDAQVSRIGTKFSPTEQSRFNTWIKNQKPICFASVGKSDTPPDQCNFFDP